MTTNAYMEPDSYPPHYTGVPDRPTPLFATDAHEPRVSRPFDVHPSNDPYSSASGAPPGPNGSIDEPPSPLSSYRGSFSHHSSLGMPHHRQDSMSSISSPHDMTGGWTPSSPGMASSRHASIYSLNGQFDSVAISGSIDGGSSSSGQLYEQSPPLPAQVRYTQAQGIDARRFSLDERSIRVQPQMGKQGMLLQEYQTPGSGRYWPWGGGGGGVGGQAPLHSRHASISAAPSQSFDYSRVSYGSSASSVMPPSYGYDANAMSAMSQPRYRSMSSSAASGRSYGNLYSPTSAAHAAAAAMGYGVAPHLGAAAMILESEIPGGSNSARRAKFKRSRTGCLVCRKRKVKCSQDGTPCKQCRIGKRDCHYDDNPQKKKTKKDKVNPVPTTSADPTNMKPNSETFGANLVNSDTPALSTSAFSLNSNPPTQHPPSDAYYPPATALDHRHSVDASVPANPSSIHPSSGGVTFSMPFSSSTATATANPTVSASYSFHNNTSIDSTANSTTHWSTSSPFSPGPHGEPHPVSCHPDEYGWTPKQHHPHHHPPPPPHHHLHHHHHQHQHHQDASSFSDVAPPPDRTNHHHWSQHSTAAYTES